MRKLVNAMLVGLVVVALGACKEESKPGVAADGGGTKPAPVAGPAETRSEKTSWPSETVLREETKRFLKDFEKKLEVRRDEIIKIADETMPDDWKDAAEALDRAIEYLKMSKPDELTPDTLEAMNPLYDAAEAIEEAEKKSALPPQLIPRLFAYAVALDKQDFLRRLDADQCLMGRDEARRRVAETYLGLYSSADTVKILNFYSYAVREMALHRRTELLLQIARASDKATKDKLQKEALNLKLVGDRIETKSYHFRYPIHGLRGGIR